MPLTQKAIAGILTDMTATGAVFDPAMTWVVPYTAGPTVTPPVAETAFTLPDATGVPAHKITAWGPPHKLDDGRIVVDGPAAVFAPDKLANAFTANGFLLVDKLTGGDVLEYVPLPEPVALSGVDHTLVIYVRVGVDPQGEWDATVIING